jgi:opacity protein-like surface antigen
VQVLKVLKLRIVIAVAALPLLVLAASTPAHAQSAASAATSGSAIFVRGYGGTTFGSPDTGGPAEHAAVIGGGVGLNLGSHLAVIGDAGYISNVASQEATAALNRVVSLITLVSGVNADVSVKAQTLYVLGGGRFILASSSARFAPFVEAQGGMMRSTYKLEITDSNSTVVSDATTIFKDVFGKTSATAPAIAAGGGVDIRLSQRLAAEAGYHYLRLFGDAKTDFHEVFGGVKFTF